ncbi:PHD finger-containing protein 1-like isoform X2 [Cornus florida]|uniref:PHD finger-containing protein 1-like isoform X2 n=1 Tax=Cornus florida TaxID=4283 RepID=UPI00289D9B26|nr:PHD finger-containing protein 1-like isoform X2 [Cornus florida]
MVAICQQCGDIGYANAFVYCVKCLDSALHRYCLDILPATFDEFVYWFCEDCKPEVAKQFPLEKPSPYPSKKRDRVSSKGDQVTGSKIKLKKKDIPCLVAETKEQRCQSSPSEQPQEAHEKLDFECAHPADDCSLLKIKQKKKSDSTCPVAATELQRHQRSPNQQRLESPTKHDLTECAQLVGDRQLKTKLKKKDEKGITCSVAATELQRHQSSPSQQRLASPTIPDLTDRAQLVGDRQLKTKLKKNNIEKGITCSVAGTEEQRHQNSSSQKSCEGHRKLDFNECAGSVAATELQRHQSSPTQQCLGSPTMSDFTAHAHFVGDRLKIKFKKKKNEKGITCSVAGTEEQKHQSSSSQKSCEGHRNLDFNECAELAGDCSLLEIKLRWKKEDVTPSVAETAEQKPQSSQPQHSYGAHRELEEGSRLDEEVGCVRIDASQTSAGHFSNTFEHNYHLLAQPIIDPIWRGSFNICNTKYGIFGGVVAHLSSKACPRAYEEASFLPTLLCTEMLPKFNVWPKSFQRSEPCDDNIALYFFPQNKTYESFFDSLVDDMVGGEFAMRVMVKNAELLVFTSDMLPLRYWKFQGKYYLWGVFKGKHASSTHQVNYDLMAQNSNKACDVHSNSAHVLGNDRERTCEDKNWDALSPPCALSKCDSYW